MNQNTQPPPDEADLKRQLVRRVAFAGLLIAMLLGALALVDYVGQPAEEPVASGPTFTEPVPVAKKEVSQPLTQAEPEPESAPAPDEAPPPAADAAAAPARPEVAAQPALPAVQPRTGGRAAPPRVAEPALPEGTAAATAPQPVPSPPRAPAEPPAPPRLISGYAVQAGVFADAQHAEELRAMLTLNGIPSTLEARVQVGPFKTRAEADAARQKLKALGIDGILLPPKGARR